MQSSHVDTFRVEKTLFFSDNGDLWPGCATQPSAINSLVMYGMRTKPSTMELPDGTILSVGEDIQDQVFYDRDLERLQAKGIGLDFCDPAKLILKWNMWFNAEYRKPNSFQPFEAPNKNAISWICIFASRSCNQTAIADCNCNNACRLINWCVQKRTQIKEKR